MSRLMEFRQEMESIASGIRVLTEGCTTMSGLRMIDNRARDYERVIKCVDVFIKKMEDEDNE